MKKSLFLILLTGIILMVSSDAFAFTVNWRNSWDPGDGIGYKYVAQWLVDNDYYSNMSDAENFAQTGYIGHDASESDPFYFDKGEYKTQIIYENGAYCKVNELGYYTGSGSTKSLVGIFSGLEGTNDWYGATSSDPKMINVDDNFGLYLYSKYKVGPWGNKQRAYWYTDRAENDSQEGSTWWRANLGGDAQALIYPLIDGQKWLVAWEDLDATRSCLRSDNDYNDMFVLVDVIPEPATLSLLGLGLLGLLGLKKRIKL